jgi:hypothetical protein
MALCRGKYRVITEEATAKFKVTIAAEATDDAGSRRTTTRLLRWLIGGGATWFVFALTLYF